MFISINDRKVYCRINLVNLNMMGARQYHYYEGRVWRNTENNRTFDDPGLTLIRSKKASCPLIRMIEVLPAGLSFSMYY